MDARVALDIFHMDYKMYTIINRLDELEDLLNTDLSEEERNKAQEEYQSLLLKRDARAEELNHDTNRQC